jgi:hypothetical protein
MTTTSDSATSIPEFLKVVESCTKEWFTDEKTWGPWFRGQTRDWALQPSLYRYPLHGIRSIRTIEDEIRQEFAVRAPSLGTEPPQNSWNSYFLMQHCGAPTRLLDWTESALIALFFAVKGKIKPQEDDAVVWILEPWKLNKIVVDISEVLAPGAEVGMVPAHAERYAAWLPDRYAVTSELSERFPIAVYPTHISRRISSQRSCFTIHGSDEDGFENIKGDARQYLRKVIIPGSKCHEIETNLSIAGVDEVTIYPDLDGLGRWLTAVLRDESLP